MLAGCPVCRARYRLDETRIGVEGIKLRCSSCRTIFMIRGRGQAPENPASDAQKTSASPVARVLVAHDSHSFRSTVLSVLSPEPFEVLTACNGVEAYARIVDQRPDVAVLDVALPGMFGFEICEAVKGATATADIKVILIASLFDKTRYKRSPESLYGVDDYIEKHHIPDELVAKIYRLLSGAMPAGSTPAGTDTPAAGAESEVSSEAIAADVEAEAKARLHLRNDEEQNAWPVSNEASAGIPEAHQKARRLARLIVSDIALYNQKLVEEGVRNGTFSELLADDIAEGHALYGRRVPEEVRAAHSYLEEAFEEFIDKMKREFNL
ncbi:MAG: response regulator [Desulfuromonadales bacterium]|nr:MAG: response regulator [Desulfuromonadales bacterium]